MPSLRERFDSKWIRTASGCWQWTACADKDGYGFLRVAGKNLKAHRVSHEIHSGPIPKGLLVLHRCDNPGCVNPDHLFLGNNSDNQIDASRKGRNASQKLTVETVREARRRYRSGETTQAALCRETGVSSGQMSLIVRGLKWRHVD